MVQTRAQVIDEIKDVWTDALDTHAVHDDIQARAAYRFFLYLAHCGFESASDSQVNAMKGEMGNFKSNQLIISKARVIVRSSSMSTALP